MTRMHPSRHRSLSSRSRPPQPSTTLEAGLLRLRREVEAFPMDPALPARVEAEVRRLLGQGSPPKPARTGRSPAAAPAATRRHAGAAAVLLLALLGAITLSGDRALGPRAAYAGPQEARALWDRAKALRDAPWRERVVAYRAAVAASNPTDRLRVRALAALAAVLREADHPHGAAAAESLAAHLGPRADETRLSAHLAHAKALRAEGERATVRALLGDVAKDARTESPRIADQALDLLAEEAFLDRDLEGVEHALAAAIKDRASPAVVIRIAGRAGELSLAAGNRLAAERHLATAERGFRAVTKRPDDEALLATKAWLDLPLRKVL